MKYIKHFYTIVLFICLSLNVNGMNLFVQTPSNGTITLDVEPSDSIENIKAKIFDAISIPTQNQLLKFNGESLSDNRTLADYNITKNSTMLLTDVTLINNIHQAILSAGGNATGSNGSASYSVGQAFYQTNTSANHSVAAGVQQAAGCPAPTITASTPTSRCGAGSVTLSATPSAGSIQWFTTETGGTALVSGTDYTISGNNLTITNLAATTTFYAQAVDGTCISAARTAVMATVNNAPAIPTFITTPATCTANGTAKINAYDATLTYTSSPTGATVGATGIITGTAGTAYTFTAANANCTSAASEAVTIPVQLSGPICTDNFITTWTCIASNTLKFNATTNGPVSYTYTTNLGKSGSGTFSSASYAQVTLTLSQATAIGEILTLVIAPTNLLRLGLSPVAIGRNSFRLTNVNQWGITPWSSMADMFLDCRVLNITATDLPVLTNVADMSNMFNGCSALNGPVNINNWNTAAVTNMSSMFSGAASFNQNIGNWNTAAVTNMSNMFKSATAFNQNIGAWNTAAVTNMSSMFFNATAFNQNIGNWNTAAVTNMSSMFQSATAFNQNIEAWNTAAVTNMSSMFSNATAFNQNIGNWNTAAVTNMSFMFSSATAFNQNIGNWNTAAVTNMSFMFNSATAFNQNIGNWNTAAVTDMSFMFNSATAFNQNIGNWNTAAVTDMSGMFGSATAFNQNIGTWNTAAVTNMGIMFSGAAAFNQNIGNWNTAAVTNMSSMFRNATAFNQNIGAWNTAAVTNMASMFFNATAFNQDIGDWNTAAVTKMDFMFNLATAFNQDIGAWNTNAVTDMTSMFSNAAAFNQDIGDWNTAAVTKMDFMFTSATAFNQNLGYWTLNPSVTMIAMLQTNGMDCANYSATLQGWAANANTPNGRNLGASGRFYGTNAVAARNSLIAKGWTISGDRANTTTCILPAPTLAAISNQTTCNGQTISNIVITLSTDLRATLTASDNSETINPTYTFGGTKANRTLTIATVAGQVGATTVTITAAGLGGTTTQTFILEVTPNPTITTSTPASRCGAGAVTLSATPSAGSIQWFTAETGGTALVSGTDYTISGNNLTINNLTATTTFYAQAVNGSCTSIARTAVTATFNTLPVPNPSSDSPKCVGTTLTFNSVAGMTTYAWSGPNSFTASTQNPTITNVSTAAQGIYTLTVTNANGCSASATTSVIVNALPMAMASSNSPICAGTSLNLSSDGGVSYTWTGANLFSSTLQNPSISSATTLASGTYQVTATNANGCTATATTSVIVNPTPVTPTTQADAQIIFGGGISLTATGCEGTIKWYQKLDDALVAMPVSPTATTQYYAKCEITSNGITCTSEKSNDVTVTVLKPMPPVATGATTCIGTGVTLTATGCSGEVGIFTLKWYQKADSILVSMPVSLTVSTDYFAKCEQTFNGVTAISGKSNFVTLVVLNPSIPAVSGAIIYKGNSTSLVATGCTGEGFTVKWYETTTNNLVMMPVSPSITTKYFAKCEQIANNLTCISNKSDDVTIMVVNRIFVDITKASLPSQNGTSWAMAYGDLQQGLAQATQGIQNELTEVWVAKGTYKPTTTASRNLSFVIPSGVKIYGGFSGMEEELNARNFRTNPTILSGEIGNQQAQNDNSYHVVVFDGSNTNTLLDGFTITGGFANFYIEKSGTGSLISSSLTSTIERGGGIILKSGSKPLIINCTFMNNAAITGGAIYANESAPQIINCKFMGNQGTFGSAIYLESNSNAGIENSLFSGNRGIGTLYNNYSNPILSNCTFGGNGGYNGGIFNSNSQPTVTNSILWGNTTPLNDTQSIISYSIVQGGYAGVGNLNFDPQFVSQTPEGLSPNLSGDYHLKPSSLAIDRGNNGSISLTDLDLDGNLRRFNAGRVDMGAFEFQGNSVSSIVISVSSGNWEINSTWDVGRVPKIGDLVIIDNNHTVNLNGEGAAKNIEYRGTGTLKFNSTNSKLNLGF